MRSIRLILLVAALMGGLVLPAAAQQVAATTTLSAAVTSTANTIRVATATTGPNAFQVNNYVWADFEAMQITAINGTTITVQRGQLGTAARAHASGNRVIAGALPVFQQVDPTTLNGTCARGSGEAAYSPWINVRTGVISMCGGSGGSGTTWTQTSRAPLTLNSIPTSF